MGQNYSRWIKIIPENHNPYSFLKKWWEVKEIDNFLKIQHKLVPELEEIVDRRFNILKTIQHSQPIGRRQLADKLKVGERSIRNEVDFLVETGLIAVSAAGTLLTAEGEELLKELDSYIKKIKGFSTLEAEVEQILGVRVLIAPTIYNPEHGKRDFGRFVAKELKEIIVSELRQGPVILAVTGGTTMEEVARAITKTETSINSLTVVPGRGGLGEETSIQADTIAEVFAKQLRGDYKVLRVADNFGKETLERICQEPQVKKVLELLANARILVHGVGTAEEMAKRRGMSDEEITRLKELGAVGEAFGFYFDESGETVYATSSVGLKLDDIRKERMRVIAVAEGEQKASAILSVVTPKYHELLITDERTAKEILELKTS